MGRVVKAHGIRGEVAVEVLSDVPGRFDPGATVWWGARTLTITSSRPHQGRLLVSFGDVADRTAAEALRGARLEAPPAPAATLDDAEHYYVQELIGLRVRAEDGTDLGEVVELIALPDAAGYDLLEVAHPDGHRWLLPAVDDLVEVATDEDGADHLVLIEPPEGLVEP